VALGLVIWLSPVRAENILTDAPVVRELAAGGAHACAVYNTSGSVYCWGLNDQGQLGTGDLTNRNRPNMAVGGLLAGKKAVSVAAGFAHTCAVTDGGAVYCWGAGDKGQLGNGTYTDSNEPVPVSDISGVSGVTKVYAGFATTCVKATDAIYCWGDNDEGQYGDGTTISSNTAKQMPGTSGVDDLAISVGHSCRVTAGTAYCSGAGADGQLGDGSGDDSLTPVAVNGIVGEVAEVSAGYFMSCAASDSGFYCWGNDTSGQLGGGASNVAKELKTWGDAAPIASGYAHSCAGFSCIGENGSGQLGDGSTTNRNAVTPVVTSGVLSGLTVKDVAAGFDFTCWVAGSSLGGLEDAVFCAGAGVDGQLGNGLAANSSVPVAVNTSGVEKEMIYISLSLDVDKVDLTVQPNSGIAAKPVNLTVVTNSANGYKLLIKAGSENLECQTDSSLKIPRQSTAGAPLEVNHWGYGTGLAEPTAWYGVTTTDAKIDDYGVATTQAGRGTKVWFGGKADYSLQACKYKGTTTFTAVGND
jgi:alpha-tubulin suppressor-like RCC1 family protein